MITLLSGQGVVRGSWIVARNVTSRERLVSDQGPSHQPPATRRSLARQQARKFGGIIELLHPQYCIAQLADLHFWQRLGRKLLELLHHVSVRREPFFAAPAGLHGAF